MSKFLNCKIFFITLFLIHSAVLSSLYGYFSNSWDHIKSEHFVISYNENTKDRAMAALKIAEEVAGAIGHYFGKNIIREKIAIVLMDSEDLSNGAAYRNMALVELHCRKTDFLWRGETHWLRTVISHELSHIYSIRIMTARINIGLSYFYFSSENKDYPDGVITTYYEHRMLPVWLLEGLAQLGSNEFKADFQDPFREMLLRDAFFNNKLLTISKMARFEGSDREAELSYNQGFDLLIYLRDKYKDSITMKDLCASIQNYGLSLAVEKCYGKSLEELYDNWKMSLQERYFIKKFSPPEGEPLFGSRKALMTTEVLSVDNGKYAIANWRHDYNRYDLFKISKEQRSYNCIAENTGLILKRDKITGNIWFNKKDFNYDVFKLNKNGDIEQVTKGDRCLAFDVIDDYLLYASYKKGVTTLTLRSKLGVKTELKSFNYNVSIYNISMISRDSVVLTIGDGDRIKAGILNNKDFNILWPGLEFDVTDVVYAGSDKLVFVSTINRTPQLYWCDIKNNFNTWYRITNAAGGVRFPGVDMKEENVSVTCAFYNNGHHRIYKLSDPFSKDNPVDISSLIKGKDDIKDIETIPFDEKREVLANIVIGMPFFFIALNTDRAKREYHAEFIEGESRARSKLFLNSMFMFKNAPGNYEFNIYGGYCLPYGYKMLPAYYPSSIGSTFKFHLWKFFFENNFLYYNNYEEYSYFAYYYVTYNIYNSLIYTVNEKALVNILRNDKYFAFTTNVKKKLNRHNELKAAYAFRKVKTTEEWTTDEPSKGAVFENEGKSITYDFGVKYAARIYSLDFKRLKHRSKFDPGNIGTPFFKIESGIDLFDNDYPATKSAYPDNYYIESSYVPKVRFNIEGCFLFFNSKLSFKLRADGFSYFKVIKDKKNVLYMYDFIGHEEYYSGYQYGAIRPWQSSRAIGELRLNPFISIVDKTCWYERMSLGIKIETGYCLYSRENKYTGNNEAASNYPVSCEFALRHSFYIWSKRKSSAYIKYALPLKRLENEEKYSYKIYFGVTI